MKKIIYLLILLNSIILNAQFEEDYVITELKSHKTKVLDLAFSLDGQFLYSSDEEKLLIVTETANWEETAKFDNNYYPVKVMQVISDDALLVASGKDIKRISLENKKLGLYTGSATHITSIDFNTEKQRIIAGSYDRKIKVWDALSQEVLFVLEGHEKSTLPAAFSSDAMFAVTGSLDRTVKVWNLEDGTEKLSLKIHADNVVTVDFHPSDRYVLSGSLDKSVRLWNIETGKIVKTFAAHDKPVTKVQFLPNGQHFLSASYDGTVYLYECFTGKRVTSFIDHEGAVTAFAFNKNGTILATGGEDGKVFIYDLGKEVYVYEKYYQELDEKKAGSSLFDEKRKGENKADYESRLQRAKKQYDAWIDEFYNDYEKYLQLNNLPK